VKKAINWLLVFCLGALVFLPIPGVPASSETTGMREHTLSQNVVVKLPVTMQVSEGTINDREQLLYSAYLNDQGTLRGYVQIWQLDNVEEFLKNSKEMSSYDFYSYSLKPIEVGELNGLLNIWGASFGGASRISGKEYWLKKSGSTEVLRIAFLTSNPAFSDDQLSTMSKIMASLRWLE
jgi:hypothetical protein